MTSSCIYLGNVVIRPNRLWKAMLNKFFNKIKDIRWTLSTMMTPMLQLRNIMNNRKGLNKDATIFFLSEFGLGVHTDAAFSLFRRITE